MNNWWGLVLVCILVCIGVGIDLHCQSKTKDNG